MEENKLHPSIISSLHAANKGWRVLKGLALWLLIHSFSTYISYEPRVRKRDHTHAPTLETRLPCEPMATIPWFCILPATASEPDLPAVTARD